MNVNLRFSEIEHTGDLDNVKADLHLADVEIINTFPEYDEEEATFLVNFTSWKQVELFERTDSVEFCTNWADIDLSSLI